MKKWYVLTCYSFSRFPDMHVFSTVGNACRFITRDIERMHDSEIEEDEREEGQVVIDDRVLKSAAPQDLLWGCVASLAARYDDEPDDLVRWYVVPEDEIIDLEADEPPWEGGES